MCTYITLLLYHLSALFVITYLNYISYFKTLMFYGLLKKICARVLELHVIYKHIKWFVTYLGILSLLSHIINWFILKK